MPALDTPASPCIKVCQLDAQQVCIGCGRSLEEIAEWSQAGAARQRQILQACAARQQARAAQERPVQVGGCDL